MVSFWTCGARAEMLTLTGCLSQMALLSAHPDCRAKRPKRASLLQRNNTGTERRKQRMAPSRSFLSALLLPLLTADQTNSFQSSPPFLSPLRTQRAPNHAFAAVPIDTIATSFHDFIYQAETAANALATASLDNTESSSTSSLATVPILYLAGLLTGLSPCVWGLLPLTLSYISTAAGERDDQNALWPTVAFAGGLAAVFCSLGVVATQVGGAVLGGGSVSASAFSSGVCLVMGLKVLELIDIPLPSIGSLRERVLGMPNGSSPEPVLIDATGQILPPQAGSSSSTTKSSDGSLFRTFLLGGSSALVSSPCATPVLTSILAFVSKASNPTYGAMLLFCYTLGYATPLLVVAGSGGQALARSTSNQLGPWVSPLTGGVLLLYGMNGLLTAIFGDPSLAALTIR